MRNLNRNVEALILLLKKRKIGPVHIVAERIVLYIPAVYLADPPAHRQRLEDVLVGLKPIPQRVNIGRRHYTLLSRRNCRVKSIIGAGLVDKTGNVYWRTRRHYIIPLSFLFRSKKS